MPIRPQDLVTSSPTFVSEDRKCVSCGYNLKGLRSTGNCPECGRPISKRRRGARYADHLVHAPMPWLVCFKLSTILLIIAAAAFVVSQFFALWARRNAPDVLLALIMGSTVLWYLGVFLVTRPRPVMPSTLIDPRQEWFALRLASRITQAGWPLLIGLGLLLVKLQANAAAATATASAAANAAGVAAPPPVTPPSVLYWMGGVAAIIAAAGIVPLCIYLSNLCFWAVDTALAINFRACAFTVTAAAAAGVLLALRFVFAGAFTGTLGTVITWPVLVAAWFFSCAATGHLLWCLWRLRSMAAWAVVHHITADDKDERMRERAERLRATERAGREQAR
jgi:predicted RNA-binding Zn-ribbon protein involved in translation (DUF1610 family)